MDGRDGEHNDPVDRPPQGKLTVEVAGCRRRRPCCSVHRRWGLLPPDPVAVVAEGLALALVLELSAGTGTETWWAAAANTISITSGLASYW